MYEGKIFGGKGMKSAIITGASRGIGKAVAYCLASMGYRVALVAKNEALLKQVAADLKEKHPSSDPIPCAVDVTSEESISSLFSKILDELQQIDILVNAAGILIPKTGSITNKELRSMVETNLYGSIYSIQAVLPKMKAQKSGYIFNVASRAGKTGISSLGGYCASKFGMVGYSESLALELAEFGIKVTSLCPGWVDTDMAKQNTSTPSEEMISPSDITKTIQFLLGLSHNCLIKEVVIDCRRTLIAAGKSSVKKT